MRLLGHPVHVMLVHFPIALWPAHWVLQVCAGLLPAQVGPIAAFWVLVAGTSLGWLAALAGVADLIELSRGSDPQKLRRGLVHAAINGSALVAFSALTIVEYATYPKVMHGAPWLIGEAVALAAMFVGNYFGGSVVWSEKPAARA